MSEYKYELVVVFDPDLDESAVSAQMEKIEAVVAAHDGTIEKKDIWGKKQLAYPIRKRSYGTYVVVVISGNNALVAELTRQLRINDAVLRFLFVKKDKFAPDFKLPVDEPADTRSRSRAPGRRRGGEFEEGQEEREDEEAAGERRSRAASRG